MNTVFILPTSPLSLTISTETSRKPPHAAIASANTRSTDAFRSNSGTRRAARIGTLNNHDCTPISAIPRPTARDEIRNDAAFSRTTAGRPPVLSSLDNSDHSTTTMERTKNPHTVRNSDSFVNFPFQSWIPV